jgi:hypothetical protein
MVTVTPVEVLNVAVSVLVVELVEPGAGPLPAFQFPGVLQLPFVAPDHVSLVALALPPASTRAHARPPAVNRGNEEIRGSDARKAWDSEVKWCMALDWLLTKKFWEGEPATKRRRKIMSAE